MPRSASSSENYLTGSAHHHEPFETMEQPQSDTKSREKVITWLQRFASLNHSSLPDEEKPSTLPFPSPDSSDYESDETVNNELDNRSGHHHHQQLKTTKSFPFRRRSILFCLVFGALVYLSVVVHKIEVGTWV